MPSPLDDIRDYYTNKLAQHGIVSQGVDWRDDQAQQLCFKQLTQIIDAEENFSVIDFGCGYGALYDFLSNRKKKFTYYGYDITENLITAAKEQHHQATNAVWTTQLEDLPKADYVIACGVFSIRLQRQTEAWEQHIQTSLHHLNNLSQKGFSFNMLTSYSDAEFMKDYLYYANPSFYFDYCKTHFSKFVSLLHDYPAYEFSILVRKNVQIVR
jgi:SAM-dependent methyltransferase